MKILVVSLLRLGDLIQQKPLLKALQNRYADSEVHLLINKQFLNFQDLLGDEVKKVLLFDREILQRSMGESNFNLFSCLDILEKTIVSVNSEKYDMILNWTHNRLSAYLLGTFESPQKIGLYADEGHLLGLDSPWLNYFNDNMSGNYKSHFHYVELLGNAFQLPVEKYKQKIPIRSSAPIYFQCLTSDLKKNWPLDNFKMLKNQLLEKYPDAKIQILCSPTEKARFQNSFKDDELKICNLNEAQSLLKKAQLLVTCDTSIKHLAAEVGTSILEISLGASDSVKTSAFSDAAVIVKGKSLCYPCIHSAECSQKRHLCAESVTVQEVLLAACKILESERESLNENETVSLEREIWQIYLDQKDIGFCIPTKLAKQILHQTAILEQYQQSFESSKNFHEIFATLKVIAEKGLDTGAYFQKLSQVFSDRFASAESAFQALKKALEQSGALIQIRKNLIEDSLSPSGGTHAERT